MALGGGGQRLTQLPLGVSETKTFRADTRRMAGTAMLAALAAVMEILPLDLPYPLIANLTLDPVGIPIALAAFLYGPTSAAATTGVAGLVLVGRGRWISASFKVAAELSTAVPLALVLYGLFLVFSEGSAGRQLALGLAMGAAVASRIAVMTAFNYVFLPIFYGIPQPAALGLLPHLAVFNLIQGLVVVLPAFLLFNRLPPDLKPGWMGRTP